MPHGCAARAVLPWAGHLPLAHRSLPLPAIWHLGHMVCLAQAALESLPSPRPVFAAVLAGLAVCPHREVWALF